jgi:hypothetical protein
MGQCSIFLLLHPSLFFVNVTLLLQRTFKLPAKGALPCRGGVLVSFADKIAVRRRPDQRSEGALRESGASMEPPDQSGGDRHEAEVFQRMLVLQWSRLTSQAETPT